LAHVIIDGEIIRERYCEAQGGQEEASAQGRRGIGHRSQCPQTSERYSVSKIVDYNELLLDGIPTSDLY
jgi:hypothetical protein